ncbi:MAG: bifunctional phosphopantothenoylcysteine decarboxylase/phosphopantothenate--cysteine ligase CoaBC [Candidatus Eremiobacteraeota bacterium]|nr:bifunctional phosphopantothenoylcysteine decarboxylase/phosphopantothenate--cysteine ligase CoaBC [Candidatus Eremiobacteraeota bacterium]
MDSTGSTLPAFAGKTVLVGVCGGIAAYKCVGVVSALRQAGADVHVVLTAAACKFVTPLSFAAVSGNDVHADMFATSRSWDVAHISLVRKSDVLLLLNATANTLAKLAYGIADNLLTTCVLATRRPVLIVPAMNSAMLEAVPTQEAIARLQDRGFEFVAAGEGFLACGEIGDGRLADQDDILAAAAAVMGRADSLCGHRVVVTAGPTREYADPIRFLSNPSSGRMGFALAAEARARGADVTLISGPTQLRPRADLRFVPVTTAREMHAAVLEHLHGASIFIGAAAVSDVRPAQVAAAKVKKEAVGELMALVANPDIIADVAAARPTGCLVVGFAAESENLETNARRKLKAKGLDCIVVNRIGGPQSAFGAALSEATMLWPDGTSDRLARAPKTLIAGAIIERIAAALNRA